MARKIAQQAPDIKLMQVRPPQFGSMTESQLATLASRAAQLEAYANGLETSFQQHEEQVGALRAEIKRLNGVILKQERAEEKRARAEARAAKIETTIEGRVLKLTPGRRVRLANGLLFVGSTSGEPVLVPDPEPDPEPEAA